MTRSHCSISRCHANSLRDLQSPIDFPGNNKSGHSLRCPFFRNHEGQCVAFSSVTNLHVIQIECRGLALSLSVAFAAILLSSTPPNKMPEPTTGRHVHDFMFHSLLPAGCCGALRTPPPACLICFLMLGILHTVETFFAHFAWSCNVRELVSYCCQTPLRAHPTRRFFQCVLLPSLSFGGCVHILSSVNRRSHQRQRPPDIRTQEFHIAPFPTSNEHPSGVSLSMNGIPTCRCLFLSVTTLSSRRPSRESGRRPDLGLTRTNCDVTVKTSLR